MRCCGPYFQRSSLDAAQETDEEDATMEAKAQAEATAGTQVPDDGGLGQGQVEAVIGFWI